MIKVDILYTCDSCRAQHQVCELGFFGPPLPTGWSHAGKSVHYCGACQHVHRRTEAETMLEIDLDTYDPGWSWIRSDVQRYSGVMGTQFGKRKFAQTRIWLPEHRTGDYKVRWEPTWKQILGYCQVHAKHHMEGISSNG